MSLALVYWILMLVWLVFGIVNAVKDASASFRGNVGNVLIFALFLILGWATFGAPVHS